MTRNVWCFFIALVLTSASTADTLTADKLKVSGVTAPVEILKDQWGVSHIYAQNQADLFFAQGFNAARDRLFQFEVWRRKALGTCLTRLNEQQRKWIDLRYGRHGGVKAEAERTGVSMHKLYYALEKIRGQLLDCVEQFLRKVGWSDA